MRRLRSGPVQLSVAAVLLVVAGVVVHTTAGDQGATFGWFAYQPFPDGAFASATVIWTRAQVAGAALVVLGLVVAAAAGGYRLGATRARSR